MLKTKRRKNFSLMAAFLEGFFFVRVFCENLVCFSRKRLRNSAFFEHFRAKIRCEKRLKVFFFFNFCKISHFLENFGAKHWIWNDKFRAKMEPIRFSFLFIKPVKDFAYRQQNDISTCCLKCLFFRATKTKTQ